MTIATLVPTPLLSVAQAFDRPFADTFFFGGGELNIGVGVRRARREGTLSAGRSLTTDKCNPARHHAS